MPTMPPLSMGTDFGSGRYAPARLVAMRSIATEPRGLNPPE